MARSPRTQVLGGADDRPPPNSVSADNGGVAVGGDVHGDVHIGLDIDAVARMFDERLKSIAGVNGVPEAPLRAVLVRPGAVDTPLSEIPARLEAAADELIRLRADLARLSNERPEFAAIRARALALIDAGDFDAADAELQKADDLSRNIIEEMSRTRAGILIDRARVDLLRLRYDSATANIAESLRLNPDQTGNWIGLGDIWQRLGSLNKARTAFEGAVASAERKGDRRGLSVSYNRIADVLVAQGERGAALRYYQDSLNIAQSLAAFDTADTELKRDLSILFTRLADVLIAYGERDAALIYYQDSLTIAKSLAESTSEDMELQRDVSVLYDRIARLLFAQGKSDESLRYYQDGLTIRKSLLVSNGKNKQWQRDLSLSFANIADVLAAHGERDEAIRYHHDALAIRKSLSASDAKNTVWQRDVSVSFDRIADIFGLARQTRRCTAQL